MAIIVQATTDRAKAAAAVAALPATQPAVGLGFGMVKTRPMKAMAKPAKNALKVASCWPI